MAAVIENRAAATRMQRVSEVRRATRALAGGVCALLAVLALAVALSPASQAATPATTTTTTSTAPSTAEQSAAEAGEHPKGARLSRTTVLEVFFENDKVASWMKRYPPKRVITTSFTDGLWTIDVSSDAAGRIATGTVDDQTGTVRSAWTGPQVLWTMARGIPGAFGGKKINSVPVWLAFCAIFLLGLVDWRRPLSLRTIDLLVLLSFSVPLWFFNRGDVFTSMPLVYPGLVWLLGRCAWMGWRNQTSRGSVVWPVWLLVAATVCLVGYRIDLNLHHSNVVDVGYGGVIGADRISRIQSPYGHFPQTGNLPTCGPEDSTGAIRDRIQTNGRCETADPRGDTYGPVAYEAYLPGFLLFGWSGKWDDLPASHATAILWDLICIVGLWLVGRRFGGPRLGATLGFAWAAWPFTQYISSSNTNDAIAPALLVWAFFFATSPRSRGAFAALSSWTKFASLIVVPLWSGYPDARDTRSRLRFVAGFLLATALAFVVLLFERDPLHNAAVFFHHTFGYQFGRSSPFSIWDWRQYHAHGLPDLHWIQRVLQVLLVVGALALAVWPRYRSPLRLAAFTGALLVGFEVVLTHWSFLYLPWFFPFVAFALLAPSRTAELVTVKPPSALADFKADWARLSERGRRIAEAAAAIGVFICSWWMLGHWFYAHPAIVDTPIYHQYSTYVGVRMVPYRDFAIEYPPGALVAFLAPSHLGGVYEERFGVLMAGCGIACIVFAALSRPPRWTLPFLAVSPLLIGAMAMTRFDFWPAALMAAAVVAFMRDRHKLGWLALAAAIAAKLFPVVLVPLAIVWTLRRRGRAELARGLVIWAVVLAATFGPFLAIAPHGLLDSVWGQLSRPIEIEALAASFLMTFGHPMIAFSHGAINVGGHGALGAATSIVGLTALVALWIAFARGPADAGRFVRYAAACVCALLAFGKVLSPQFLIWLVPIVPLVRGRRGIAATAVLVAVLVDTLVWFPSRFYAYANDGHLAGLVLLRDLLLVALFFVLSLPAGLLDRPPLRRVASWFPGKRPI